MSHIPNSAMPHAKPSDENEKETKEKKTVSQRAGKLKDKARENPKTAIAAGAAVLAGAVAAVAVPVARRRKKSAEEGETGMSKSSTGSAAKGDSGSTETGSSGKGSKKS